MDLVLLLGYAYLIGSVPTAYLVGRWVKGIDIRKYGTGNVGGSNVWYHVGPLWAAVVVVFEVLGKGASPVWLGHEVLGYPLHSWPLVTAALVAVAAHNWPVWLGFAGGRGVATAGGALLALAHPALWPPLAVGALGLVVTRSSALWVLVALALMPVSVWAMGMPGEVLAFTVGLLALIVLKRLMGNWERPRSGEPWRRVLLYRLLYDRDTRDRAAWQLRGPTPGPTTAPPSHKRSTPL